MSFAYTGGMHMMGVPPSGGGGGDAGNIDPSDATFELVDLTDGWTKVDPDSIISGVTIDASGVHTFTYNAVNPVSSTYRLTNSVPEWPRWYRRLNIKSTDMTGDDVLIYSSYISDTTHNSTFGIECVHGLAEAPTNVTNQSNVKLAGNLLRMNNSGQKYSGAFTSNNLQVWNSQANQTRFYGHTITRKGLCIGVAGFGIKNTGVISGSGFRNYPASNTYGSAAAIYEVFALAFQSTSNPAANGDTVKMKLRRRALRYNQDS